MIVREQEQWEYLRIGKNIIPVRSYKRNFGHHIMRGILEAMVVTIVFLFIVWVVITR